MPIYLPNDLRLQLAPVRAVVLVVVFIVTGEIQTPSLSRRSYIQCAAAYPVRMPIDAKCI